MQLKPVGRAVPPARTKPLRRGEGPSPPFRDFRSIFTSGTGSQFSVWLSFTVGLVKLPQRRGRDTAPYQATDIQRQRSGGVLAGADFLVQLVVVAGHD